MRLISKHIAKDLSGTVSLEPSSDEDMYHLYQIILPGNGDEVKASAVRKVTSVSSTGSTNSERVKMTLQVAVEKVAFTPSSTPSGEGAVKEEIAGAQLHLSGKTTAQSSHLKIGTFHTLDLEPMKSFQLIKGPGGWDSVALARIEEACSQQSKSIEVAAVLIELKSAILCTLSGNITSIKQTIQATGSKHKAVPKSSQDKSTEKFYLNVLNAMVQHFEPFFATLKVLIIAGPGFAKDDFFSFMFSHAANTGNKTILQLKPKVFKVQTNSAHSHALIEALSNPDVAANLQDTKYAVESAVMDRFNRQLDIDEMKAWYGPPHVALAAKRGAIGTLLISDNLFRASSPSERQRWVSLVDTVAQSRGKVHIFSSMHESGAQLNLLGEVAAILTYPLDLDVVEAEEAEARETLDLTSDVEGISLNSAKKL